MDLLFKIGATGFVTYIVVMLLDGLCKYHHEQVPENKNVKYESPITIALAGVGSVFTVGVCIVLSLLVGIWS